MRPLVQTTITLLLIGAIFFGLLTLIKSPAPVPVRTSFSATDIFDNHLFLSGVASASSLLSPQYSIKSLIVPHHQIASPLIATGIRLASLSQTPKTILLFGPNHPDTGNCEIQSAYNSWNTPFGQVNTDENFVNQLVKQGIVCVNDQTLRVEHSISIPISYIKYYFPKSKVIYLTLKNKVDPKTLSRLAEYINSNQDIALSIASIDFAHGVDSASSRDNSNQVRAAIENNDETKIRSLSSQFVDSPSSILLLLKINHYRDLDESHFIMQTDATEFLQNEPKITTGYQLVAFSPNTPASDVSLLFTGDVMLGRSINSTYKKQTDTNWPFLPDIVKVTSAADLTIINLESPLSKTCTPTDSGMRFCAEDSQITSLVNAGVDIANLANNHIGNQGTKGIIHTKEVLESNKIDSIGLEAPLVKTINHQTIAFVGFNDIPPFESGVSKLTEPFLISQINQATASAKTVIAIFHWGVEYQAKPSTRQIKYAHLAIDSGASVVVGHHPHWVQSSEIYKGKPIYYSLGNFVFDQYWSENTKKGLLLKLNITPDGKIGTKEIPINISSNGEPSL